MTEQLSPAAQAVLDATGRKTWYRNNDIAAALRAAAKQLGEELEFYNAKVIDVEELLALAAELEQSN